MARFSSLSLFRRISGGGSRRQVMASPRYVPRASVQSNRGPIVSRNNPVATRHYANVNNMLNNRMYTKGYAVASPSGYGEAHNQMRGLVHMGEGFRGRVLNAMNRDFAMRNRPPIIVTRPRVGGATRVVGATGGQVGGVVNNSWRAQQNNAGLGRNKRYSRGMSQFAINNSANSGLNRMR